jgi:hypothetical protein
LRGRPRHLNASSPIPHSPCPQAFLLPLCEMFHVFVFVFVFAVAVEVAVAFPRGVLQAASS